MTVSLSISFERMLSIIFIEVLTDQRTFTNTQKSNDTHNISLSDFQADIFQHSEKPLLSYKMF